MNRPVQRQDRLARVYDDEILPLWGQRFGQMLLRAIEPTPRSAVLEVGCATGHVTVELLRRLDAETRIVAIDPSATLLDVARGKAGAENAGKRVFFRSQPLFPRLGFADDVYDTVVSNLALANAPDRPAAVQDLARVAKPGGQVVVTMPLAGTWVELHDIYREVLLKHDKTEALRALDDLVATFPEGDTLARWMEAAGLRDVGVEVQSWDLLFRSSREFFFAPVIEHGPLPRWKEIAGRGDEMQDVFFLIKEAIDVYFAGQAFSVGVVAGCVTGRKPASSGGGGGPGNPGDDRDRDASSTSATSDSDQARMG